MVFLFLSFLSRPNPLSANSVPNPLVGSGTASAGRASSSGFLVWDARELLSSEASSGYSSKSLLMPPKSSSYSLLSVDDSSGSSSKSLLMPAKSSSFSLLSVDDSSGYSSKSPLTLAKSTWFSLLSVDDSSGSVSKSLLALAKSTWFSLLFVDDSSGSSSKLPLIFAKSVASLLIDEYPVFSDESESVFAAVLSSFVSGSGNSDST